jgi:hypothetical protein
MEFAATSKITLFGARTVQPVEKGTVQPVEKDCMEVKFIHL